jgi:hypothetical protein
MLPDKGVKAIMHIKGNCRTMQSLFHSPLLHLRTTDHQPGVLLTLVHPIPATLCPPYFDLHGRLTFVHDAAILARRCHSVWISSRTFFERSCTRRLQALGMDQNAKPRQMAPPNMLSLACRLCKPPCHCGLKGLREAPRSLSWFDSCEYCLLCVV